MLQWLGPAILALASGQEWSNGDFEARPDKQGQPPGWTFEVGARNGANEPLSTVELDRKVKHSGRASLHFAGRPDTRAWLAAKQPIEVRTGGHYTLSAWARTEDVRPNGFGLDNGYVALFFFDVSGRLVARQTAHPQLPDSDWTRLEVTADAPAQARTACAFVFLSMLGDLWVDDVELAIEGGTPVPEPEVVYREDFSSARKLPSAWTATVQATNGDGSSQSKLDVDASVGAPGSPGSLHLSGARGTVRWLHPVLTYPAGAGQRWTWKARLRTRGVPLDWPHFKNLHLNMAFVDEKGDILPPAQFASLSVGDHDWTDLSVCADAPEAAHGVRAGVFLSMPGDLWLDDCELSVEKGVPVPYGDWIALAGKGVELRYAPDHPRAAAMRGLLERLEASRRATLDFLEVEFPDGITIFVYNDLDQGLRLTGKTLDFADPQGRRVHQRFESTIGHEMAHVIAHNTLQYGQTGILGEGLAVWLNGAPFDSHHAAARALLDAGKLPSVRRLLEHFREEQQGYPAAGSFCGYLIEEFGLAVFKELYPLADPSAGLKEREGVSFEDLEEGWHKRLGAR